MIGPINIWNQLNWFAIQAKPHQEELAAARIARLDLEVFLPRVKRWKSVCGVSRVLTRPLFPGYFFVRFVPLISLDTVRFCLGVLRVVGSNLFPSPVALEIVSGLQQRVCTDGVVELEPGCMRSGDPVRIEQGPFEGLMGKVTREADDHRRVAILLEAINNAILVIERGWVAPADSV